MPERSANILAFWDATPELQLRSFVRHVGRRFADNANSAVSRIPAYTVLDLGARWQVRPNLNLDVRLDNTLDEAYADSGNSTAWLLGSPRAVIVGTGVTFSSRGWRPAWRLGAETSRNCTSPGDTHLSPSRVVQKRWRRFPP